MKYYAYKGRKPLGREALGTSGKLLFELKTDDRAIRRALRHFGECSVFKYRSFYDDKTFTRIY